MSANRLYGSPLAKESLRIGLAFNRSRAYGRRFCEGVASYTAVRPEWHLEMIEDGFAGARGYDGIIAHVMDVAAADRLASPGVPVVADFYRRVFPGFAQAMPDHDAIGSMAAMHFLERGFRNFAFCGYDGIIFSDERKRGFVSALAEKGFGCSVFATGPKTLDDFDTRVILREELTPLAPDRKRLAKWLKALPRPCALFCCHDLRAFQALSAAKESGLRVPEDVAILGVDNDMLICSFTAPRLSSIDNDSFGVGRAAAKLLDDIISGRCARDAVVKVPPKGVFPHASTDVFAYSSPLVNEALAFMRGNISRNLTAADVFAHLGKSHTSVGKAFASELGAPVQIVLARLRLEEARRLMVSTALPLAEIARMSGFSSVHYFAQSFKAAFGESPASWRAKDGLRK